MDKELIFSRDLVYSFITLLYSILDNPEVAKKIFKKSLFQNGAAAPELEKTAELQLDNIYQIFENFQEVFPWEYIENEDKSISIIFSNENFDNENEKLSEEKVDPFLGIDFGGFNLDSK